MKIIYTSLGLYEIVQKKKIKYNVSRTLGWVVIGRYSIK